MINVATIMKQVQDWLKTGQDFQGWAVERSGFVNEDPGRATAPGWIGIYRRGIDYDPSNLGKNNNNYDATLDFTIIVQQANMQSGEKCEDDLEVAVKNVLDRMQDLPRTYVDHFSDIVIDYTYLETDRKTIYFQGALITFTAEVSTEIN